MVSSIAWIGVGSGQNIQVFVNMPNVATRCVVVKVVRRCPMFTLASLRDGGPRAVGGIHSAVLEA